MMNKSLFAQKLNNKWQKLVHSDVRQSTTKKIFATIFAIFIAFAIALIIACSVCNTWSKFGEVLTTIFTAGFKVTTVNNLISNMAILVVGGLSFIFAYKAGLFNIGISGQLFAAATGATILSHMGGLGQGLNQFLVLIISMGIGAIMAAIVGALKAYLKVNEVVSSIMFNWIIYFLCIMTLGMLPIPHDSSGLSTASPGKELLLQIDGNSMIPLIIIAAVLIIFVAVVLNYTVFGRKQRVTGLSTTGALAAGYNVKANMITSMAISGAIAGILGAMIYLGFTPNMPVTAAAKAIPQEGFNGISVGLISMCNPFASVPVSLFFSMVKASVADLQLLGIDNHIADVVFGIVVYGAAAITLFLNIKPYWLTLDIFKGKNYSKIRHERNMSNIELLSLSSDQCAILNKYFVYYQKNANIKSTLKLSPLTRLKMWFANIKFLIERNNVKLAVKRNQRVDLFTGKKFFKQEMAHIVKTKGKLIVNLATKKCGGWYVKLTDQNLSSQLLRSKIRQATKANCNALLMQQLNEVHASFKEKPFNPHGIMRTARLAYLQNLRSGLTYRNNISKQNKLTYFTFVQTKQQAEAIGLAEIRSKKQYKFIRSAYFKAYQKTFDVVKHHYDTMVKTYGRGKQLNVFALRFNPATLEQLYINNLKAEIQAISHLINCPLTKTQLAEVGGLVSQQRYLEGKIQSNMNQASAYRKLAQPYFAKNEKLNDRAGDCYTELKANVKLINKLTAGGYSGSQFSEINDVLERVHQLNKEINHLNTQAISAKQIAYDYINRSKVINDVISTDRLESDETNARIAAIVERARYNEKILERERYLEQKAANEKVDAELKKIAEKKAIKEAKLAEKHKKEMEKLQKKKAKERVLKEEMRAKRETMIAQAVLAKRRAESIQRAKDAEWKRKQEIKAAKREAKEQERKQLLADQKRQKEAKAQAKALIKKEREAAKQERKERKEQYKKSMEGGQE